MIEVRAEWDDGAWVVTVPSVPGAVSQSTRLDLVPRDAAEAIGLITGQEPEPSEFDVHWVVPGEPGAIAEHVNELRREADRAMQEATQETRRAVRTLRRCGLSLRDVGRVTGVSYQRAQQIEREPANH